MSVGGVEIDKKHPHLTAEELAEFREIFNLVDLDKGGTISKDELKQLMHTLGLRPSQEELNAMVDEIDADGNGEIDFDEFVTVMSRKVNTSYTPAQVKAAFKVFEKDSPPGFVTMAALEQVRTQRPGSLRCSRPHSRHSGSGPPAWPHVHLLCMCPPLSLSLGGRARADCGAGADDVRQREALARRRAGAPVTDRTRRERAHQLH